MTDLLRSESTVSSASPTASPNMSGDLAMSAGNEVQSSDPPAIFRRTRPKTIAMKRLTKEEMRIGALLYPERSYWRPKTRGECSNVARPCPYVSCKYHLYVDINPTTGSIKVNFPDREVWELSHSCALDVAERGGTTLEEVGEILNLTRERIRQVEVRGLLRLKEAGGADLLSHLVEGA